jgi:hypothetical protein
MGCLRGVKVIALFGTDTIPTPFTSQAFPSDVKAALQAKNPGVYVH